MAVNKASPQQNCIEQVHHSKIKVTDPGTAKAAVFTNRDRTEVRRIRMDACLAPVGTIAADWVVSKEGVVDIIVELKGRNVGHAVDQIETTLGFWESHPEHDVGQPIGAWIMCTEYPRASTKVARYRERLRARGTILIVSTHNGEERPFSDFVPSRP